MVVTPALVVVTLTEDGSDDAMPVLQHLVKLFLQQIEPITQTHRVSFRPYDAEHRSWVVKNRWDTGSARDQQGLTELVRYLARVVCTGPAPHLAIHHFDADTPWSAGSDPPRLEKWRRLVRAPVGRIAGAERVEYLVPLVPHPEIEAWIYLNVERLAELAARSGRTAPDPPAGGWDSCTGVKDEHPWPRAACNAELAISFPMPAALDASPSLRAALARLRQVPGLAQTLAGTAAGE